jgi:hypothetical protein
MQPVGMTNDASKRLLEPSLANPAIDNDSDAAKLLRLHSVLAKLSHLLNLSLMKSRLESKLDSASSTSIVMCPYLGQVRMGTCTNTGKQCDVTFMLAAHLTVGRCLPTCSWIGRSAGGMRHGRA